MGLVAELAECMVYSCTEKGNKKTTTAGKLVAINVFNGQFMGLSLPLDNPLVRSVNQGIKRAHVERGSQQRERETDIDEGAREYPLLGGWGRGGVDRLGVVPVLLCCGHREYSRGRRESSIVFIVSGGAMPRFSGITSSWGEAGDRRRTR